MRGWKDIETVRGDIIIGARVERGDPDRTDTAFRAPFEG